MATAKDIHLLSSYYLTHSFTPGLTPFLSIMDLPLEAALEVEDAFIHKASPRDMDSQTRIASYYRHRIEVEDWLRDEAANLGVTMRAWHPVYFRLTGEGQSRQWRDKHHVSLPVASVGLACCSFTVGDSFPNRLYVEDNSYSYTQMTPHGFLGRVMPLADTALALSGLAALGDLPGDYIEVQMWDRPTADDYCRTPSKT